MKKFLSFALALLMVVGMVPAFVQTADAAKTIYNRDLAAAGTITVKYGSVILDGNVDAGFGAADFVSTNTFNTNLKRTEYWFRYDEANFYVIARVYDSNVRRGSDFWSSDSLYFRFDTNLDGTPGEAIDNIQFDTTTAAFANANRALKYTADGLIYEVRYTKSQLGSIKLEPGSTFQAKTEYYEQADAWMLRITQPFQFKLADSALVFNKGTATVDGKISANEWGNPVYAADYSVYGGPNRVEYYFSYDYDYLYGAMIVFDTTYTKGPDWVSSNFFCVRFDTNNDGVPNESVSVISILNDDSIYSDFSGDNKAALTYDGSVAVMEFKMKRTMTEGTNFLCRPQYVECVNGSLKWYFTDLNLTAGSVVYQIDENDNIVIDGNVTHNEWGAADFDMNRQFTVNESPAVRRYIKNQYVSGIPTAEFYWRHDANNMYVAISYDYGGYGAAGYEGWNYRNQYDGTFKCYLDLRYRSHTSSVKLVLGNYTKTIAAGSYEAGKPHNIDGVTFAYTNDGGVANYEIVIPMSKITSGSIFNGYVSLEDRVSADQVVVSGTPALYNGNQLFTNGVRPLNNCVVDVTSVSLYTDANRRDTFVLDTRSAPAYVGDDEVSTGPSATPTPNPTTPSLQPGLAPTTPTPTPNPIPAPSTPVTAASFTDVKKGDWFYEDLEYVVNAGLMNGVGNNKFAPGNDLDRAMLVTTLWRLAGEPTVNVNTFDDVPRNAWYTSAVNWAAEDGIVKGYAGCFNPTDGITREQVVAILHRYADMMGYKSSDFSNRYYKTSDWAAEDVAWADANGLLDIDTDMEDMTETANRAEIAALLATFCRTFVD